MKNPFLKLNTDDDYSMNSELTVSVNRNLDRIDFVHETQRGHIEHIQVYPHQIDFLCNFLKESKEWIESNYKKDLAPKTYDEFNKDK